jgi:hypothetical protein
VIQCPECDHNFPDGQSGKTDCPNCLTHLLLVPGDTFARVMVSTVPTLKILKSTSPTPKGVVTRRTKLSSSPDFTPCPICGDKVEWITSVLGKMVEGFGSRWMEDKDHPKLSLDHQGNVIETEVMKRVGFLKTRKVRICGKSACLKKLIEVIPEWDKGTNRLPATERFVEARTASKGELRIDPTWMTARGRKF